MDTFYANAPRKSEILAGQDINANVGISSLMFNDVLGPNRIINRNAKGKDLLFLIKARKLKVLLSYFTHKCYTTWKSFTVGNSPHMLDNFICSESFFKRVRECKVNNIGVRSDHLAVIVSLRTTAIKFKVKEKINKIIDRKKINGDAETNIEFNLRLSENITNEHKYTDFNDAILQAAKVAITTKPTNQGWFYHSKDHLIPSIELCDHLLTILCNMNEEDTRNVRLKL